MLQSFTLFCNVPVKSSSFKLTYKFVDYMALIIVIMTDILSTYCYKKIYFVGLRLTIHSISSINDYGPGIQRFSFEGRESRKIALNHPKTLI